MSQIVSHQYSTRCLGPFHDVEIIYSVVAVSNEVSALSNCPRLLSLAYCYNVFSFSSEKTYFKTLYGHVNTHYDSF